MAESNSLPTSIFIPIFVVLSVAILVAGIALFCISRRNPRGCGVFQFSCLSSLRRSRRGYSSAKRPPPLSPEALKELKFSIPRNLPTSPNPLATKFAHGAPTFHVDTEAQRGSTYLKTPASSRPVSRESRPATASSHFSEAFLRPVGFLSGLSRSTTPVWNRRLTDTEMGPGRTSKDIHDPSWSAPSAWDIAEVPAGSPHTASAPTMPMPAFLQAHAVPVDARTIDPSNFPMPKLGHSSSKYPSRWSNSQDTEGGTTTRRASTERGRSSIGGDSVFCTCDLLDDIQEGREMRTPSRMSTDSEYQGPHKECRACSRHLGQSRSGQTSRAPSVYVRKPRRPRRFGSKKVKGITEIEGRLYQG